MDLTTLSIGRHLAEIRARGTEKSDLAAASLRTIERLNPRLNAFITVTNSTDEAAFSDPNLPLAGIPIAVKDLFDTRGIRTTGGSRFFEDRIPQDDALVVQKIKKAGAVIVGKTNTHEIALGVTTNNPHFGACHNPWDESRIPGGSSGGSAVAVASGMALAALGTDTGGSIRIPASLCGVTGMKPTFGRVSLRGVLPLSWNLDHAGPLTRTAEDAALILQIISGFDDLDPASVKTLPGDYTSHINDGLRDRKIAFAVGEFIEAADAEVLIAVHEARRVLKELGASLYEVDVDFLREAALANATMTQADAATFHRDRLREHPDWFGADVRQRLETGAACTASEYILARRTQAEARRQLERIFDEYDSLLLPTTPITAPRIAGDDAVERARVLTRFTSPFNLAGLPALSIPCGYSREHLPVGLQIVSRAWNEAGVLRVGHAYQSLTDWHTQAPPLDDMHLTD